MGRSLDHAGFTFPMGYLFGLTLSTAGSSATFSVATGEAVDVGLGGLMTLGTAISKTTSAWAVGSTSGALDTGTIAASTWYHVYLIKRVDTGVVDVLVSLSATSPTMPTNYTLKRRIGSMRTDGSSNWLAFLQIGDRFIWNTPTVDYNTTLGTTSVLITLTVPTGVNVDARMNVGIFSTANGFAVFSTSLLAAQTANTPVGNINMAIASVASNNYAQISLTTNVSGQIRGVNGSAISTSAQIVTTDWLDTRGKLS